MVNVGRPSAGSIRTRVAIALGLVLVLIALGVVRLVDPSIMGHGGGSTTLVPGASGLPPMTLRWSDEFGGTALDLTRWEESGLWYDKGHYSPDGHGGDLASPGQVKVGGGKLVL